MNDNPIEVEPVSSQSVSVSITADEIRKFLIERASSRETLTTYGRVLGITLVVLVVVLSLLAIGLGGPTGRINGRSVNDLIWFVIVCAVLGGTVGSAIGVWVLSYRQIRMAMENFYTVHQQNPCTYSITLNEDHVDYHSHDSRSIFPWRVFTGAVTSKNYVALRTINKTELHAPNSAFASPEHRLAFLSYIQSHAGKPSVSSNTTEVA